MTDLGLTILVVIICLVLGLIVCILSGIAGSKHYFVCRNCGEIFRPKWTQMCFNAHVFDEHLLKCPFCKVKGFCGDKGKNFNN